MPIVHVTEYPECSMVTLWCPGCNESHTITVGGGKAWTWDGDLERPTISPSILAWARDTLIDPTLDGDALTNPNNVRHIPRCHSFVRAGRWEFLPDSEHALAGQTVDVVPIPSGEV